MKYSFSTLGCPNWEFWDIFSIAKDLGYSAVEIRGIGREIDATKIKELSAQKDKTIEKLKKMDLSISMLTSGATTAIHGKQNEGLEEAKKYIDLAKELNVPYVRIMSTDKPQYDGGDPDLAKKVFQEIVEYANGTGVVPLMETNGLFVDSKKLAEFIDSITGNCGVLWDIHHPYRFNGESVEETIKNLGDKIKYVHIKDSKIEKGVNTYKLLGKGDVPIIDAIKGLKTIGYDGFISLEWVKRWNKSLEEPGLVFDHFINYMKNIK